MDYCSLIRQYLILGSYLEAKLEMELAKRFGFAKIIIIQDKVYHMHRAAELVTTEQK